MDATIEANFARMDALNSELLLIIHKLNNNHDAVERLSIVSDSLKVIKTYDDTLTINGFQVSQSIEPSAEYMYQLKSHKLKLSDLKFRLREAQLESKRQEDAFEREQVAEYLKNNFETEKEEEMNGDRDRLFQYDDKKLQVPKKTKEQLLLEKNKQVTSKFLKTRQLLETSAFQSDMALENFAESSQSLQHMNESFDFMGDMLNVARSLVNSLNQLGAKQRTQVKYSLYFFIGCCAFVIFRRTLTMFSRIYWLLSLPIRFLLMPFRLMLAIMKIILGKNSSVVENAEQIFQLSETALEQTITSVNDMIATTTTAAVSSITTSVSLVEGYEEFSKQLSSIINEDDAYDTTNTLLSTAIRTATNRIADEL